MVDGDEIAVADDELVDLDHVHRSTLLAGSGGWNSARRLDTRQVRFRNARHPTPPERPGWRQGRARSPARSGGSCRARPCHSITTGGSARLAEPATKSAASIRAQSNEVRTAAVCGQHRRGRTTPSARRASSAIANARSTSRTTRWPRSSATSCCASRTSRRPTRPTEPGPMTTSSCARRRLRPRQLRRASAGPPLGDRRPSSACSIPSARRSSRGRCSCCIAAWARASCAR